jgi:hypothetical protein
VADRSADFRVPYRQQSSEQQQSIDHKPSRPSPQPETRRGIQMTVNRTTITLRRLADRRTRTIRPPSGVVDAELENGGLFYAFNARRTTMPGRLVFVPFPDLVR